MRRCEIVTGRYPPNEMQDRLAACDVPVYLLYPSSTAVDLDEVSVASDAKALVQNEGTASKARALRMRDAARASFRRTRWVIQMSTKQRFRRKQTRKTEP